MSSANTSDHFPPASPAYYDYTEEFYPANNASVSADPPPKFLLDRTIHEDRPLSNEWHAAVNSANMHTRVNTINTSHQANLSDKTVIPSVEKNKQELTQSAEGFNTIQSSYGELKSISSAPTIDSLENIVLMYGDEPNGSSTLGENFQSRQRFYKNFSEWNLRRDFTEVALETGKESLQGDNRTLPARSEGGPAEDAFSDASSFTFSSEFPVFPKPPAKDAKFVNEIHTKSHRHNEELPQVPYKTIGAMVASHLKSSPRRSCEIRPLQLRNEDSYDGKLLQRPASSQSSPYQPSGVFSDEDDLEGLSNILVSHSPNKGPGVPPKQFLETMKRPTPSSKDPAFPEQLPDASSKVRTQLYVAEIYNGPLENYSNGDTSVLRKAIIRPDSPMLAPKPISPTRQLKFKNSVPQLMKALPLIPGDSNLRALSPPSRTTSVEVTVPFRFSPLLLEPREVASPAAQSVELDSIPVYHIAAHPTTPPPPPKLKLKKRTASLYRPQSSSSSRPWNLDENYPWTDQPPNVRLPSILHDIPSEESKPTRFKLKVTRPSPMATSSSSAPSTVRTKKKPDDAGMQVNFDLRSPQDLLSPPAGLNSIFRQVTNQFSSKKIKPEGTIIGSADHPTLHQGERLNASFEVPLLSPTTQQGPTDVRSFFSDDSSHLKNNSLRKRISQLRAKLPTPYGLKPGAQSYDDILYRERSAGEAEMAARTKLDLNMVATHDMETVVSVRLPRKHRIKGKVSGWFDKARTAATTLVRTGRRKRYRQKRMYSGV
jgi:hypothetical protein